MPRRRDWKFRAMVQSLEGKTLMSAMAATAPRQPAQLHARAIAPIPALIGKVDGTAKGMPGTVVLDRGSGNLNGVGRVRFYGNIQFKKGTAELVITGPNGHAYRVSSTSVQYTKRASRGIFGSYQTYNMSMIFDVNATTDKVKPGPGQLRLTLRMIKFGNMDYRGVYSAQLSRLRIG